jgi:hypothetical protein
MVRPLGALWRLQRALTLCGTAGTIRRNYYKRATINVLPDDVLLEIFDFCRRNSYTYHDMWNWRLLVHICQRWRRLVFASSHRLNLQIRCTYGTPVSNNLDIWPALPIIVDYCDSYPTGGISPYDEDNIIAAFHSAHLDRVRSVKLDVTGLQLGRIATAMQEPFPVLIHLDIGSDHGTAPVLPPKFLGRSAPCLQEVSLSGVPYPSLPTLLLSASDLVTLNLRNIPSTGYLSPEAMVVGLAAIPRLKSFIIEYQSATHRPDRIHLPSVTRTVLPALTSFQFQGASEYLEDLLARIDAPQLNQVLIFYLNQLVDFQAAQLSRFIDRSLRPELTLFRHAHVTFFANKVCFVMSQDPSWDWCSATAVVPCAGIDWQVSHITQVLSEISATLSNVVHLKLDVQLNNYRPLEGTDDVEWLHLLRQFPTVRTLYVSWDLARHVARALEDIMADTATEILPSLELIYIGGQLASSIRKFIAVRRRSGRPAIVIGTRMEFDERLKFYITN